MSDQVHSDELPPAYFLSLSLENVRCFGPEQTLDLTNEEGNPAQWTVLLGDNGTGKTTLLQAIAALEIDVEWNSELEDRHRDPFPKGEPFWKKAPAILELRRSLKDWVSFLRSASSETTLKVGFSVGASLSEGGGAKLESTLELCLKGGRRISVRGYPEHGNIFKTHCVGYGASRAMDEAGIMSDQEDGMATEGLFLDSHSLPNVTEWLLQADYAAKSEKPKAALLRDQIRDVLAHPDSGILPDVDDLRFAHQEGDASPPRVEFHTPYGWVTIDQLSLGYRTMIAWVVDLARRLFKRYPESDNPLAEPAVCLVDEIDLHLHPKWQRKIIDFLSDRFPNTQFIVTAHSPLVVQAAQDANIALLKRVAVDDGDDYVEIHNDMEPVGNLRVDQILTSDLYGLESARPPDVDDLLEERRELLSKSELTDEDEARLDEIEKRVGDVPAGETKEQREAMAFIKDVADRLDEDE
jgi:energy-coupling factor transporter ATP-binding protein EcfA2